MWTPQQRIGLAIIGLTIAAVLTWRWATNPSTIPDPQPLSGARAAELPDGMDPNTADAATLAAIPGVGTALAERIVEYRQERQRAGQKGPAFAFPEDLKNVKGIGDSMLRTIGPYMKFPETGK